MLIRKVVLKARSQISVSTFVHGVSAVGSLPGSGHVPEDEGFVAASSLLGYPPAIS